MLTTTSIYEDLGPFQCTVFGEVGRPVDDQTFKVHCSGKNWSQNAQNAFAQTELVVTIK